MAYSCSDAIVDLSEIVCRACPRQKECEELEDLEILTNCVILALPECPVKWPDDKKIPEV